MALFVDRTDAGRDLAAALTSWRDTDAVVAGIPRGGVVVAGAVASALRLELTAVVVRKLGAPSHEEFALGAIAEDETRVVDEDARRRHGVSEAELAAVEEAERQELRRRRALFGSLTVEVADRPVLVIDDGVATGATAAAACSSLRARGVGRLVLAVPVAPADWRPPPGIVDEYVCPHPQRAFWSVGEFYRDFSQTSDAEVVELLSHGPRA